MASNVFDRQTVHCGRLISAKFVGKSHPLDGKKTLEIRTYENVYLNCKSLASFQNKEPSNGLLYFAPKMKSARVPRGKRMQQEATQFAV